MFSTPRAQPWLLLALAAPALVELSAQETFSPDRLPSYVHPPVLAPIPDGIKLEVPQLLGNQRLAKLGVLDVTAAPFLADPTGSRDSTTALQRAIDFARDAQMICFFPPGKYLVSDTLLLRHGIHMRSHRATLMNNRLMPCVLVGSQALAAKAESARPRIVLAPNSPGFNDPQRVKYVIEHRQYDVRKFTITQNTNGGGPSLMNTMVLNLDIEIGHGNPGAAGMHIRSCEGSAVQNVTIDATHGYAGLVGATGNGGSWANVTVIGGQVGLDMRGWTPPTPTMVGITLINQTKAAIIHNCRGSLTAVGLHIRSRIPGPLIIGEPTWGPFDGSINLIDSQVAFDRSSENSQQTTAIASAGNVYLNNVYLHGADAIVAGEPTGDHNGWVLVEEFAAGKQRSKKGYALSSPVYVDGKPIGRTMRRVVDSGPPPSDLQSRHLWDPTALSWESPDAANVTAPPYSAKGDGLTDDTDALQRAIDENRRVFLPKGYYRITKTLNLKRHTRLVGVASHLSVIMARDPSQFQQQGGQSSPLVETPNDADAETAVAYIGVRIPMEARRTAKLQTNPLFALHWQSGRKSLFLSNDVHPLRVFGFRRNKAYESPAMSDPTVLVTGHGGGKWYNYHTTQFFAPTTPTQRAILVQGASGPLRFYNFEPQGGRGLAVAQFDRSRYISLFGCKTECDTTFLRIINCNHIRVFGHGGIGNANKGGALYVVRDTPNFLISNIADQVNLGPDKPYYNGHSIHRNIRSYSPLLHQSPDAEAIRLPPLQRPVLYRFGTPLANP